MKRFAALMMLLAAASSSEAANIVFISFHPGDDTPSTAAASAGFTRAPDAGYTDLLKNAGHTVTRVVSSDLPNAAQLNAADLVIISRSVPSAHYELDAETAAWNGITAPTIILGGYIIRNVRLGYTTGGTIPDSTGPIALKAQVPGHPVFAGVTLDAEGRMVNPYANLATISGTPQRGVSVNTSPIATGGIVLATVGTSTDPTVGGMIIGEWLAGDAMATAPSDTLGGHRMVLLTGSREVNGAPTTEIAGIYDLTPDGEKILLNAVTYMTSGQIAVKTVTTVDNVTPGAGNLSLLEALNTVQAGETIRFRIPGAGPHVITTPLGGYPLITGNSVNIDGYTQPGSMRNTNSILGSNSAQVRIVLDSSGADTAENPLNPARPLRRSTRLDFPNDIGNTGYGETENCILGVYGADNVTIGGLAFLGRRTAGTENDPSIYGVALIREALNARVQGSRFGVAPGAGTALADLRPVASAVAAFRWRIGGDVFSGGAVVGTDGDGASDRGEFNVIVGGRIALAMELPNLRIAGNFVNVYPSGVNFMDLDGNYALWREAFDQAGEDPDDVTIENFENGRIADNTIVGTDGNGLSDADERNIFGHVVYGHAGEVYSAGTNLVVAGNYYGIGVDGMTTGPVSTNVEPDLIELPGTASIRIGSNGDGVSDALEGNVIANMRGTKFCASGNTVPITARGNSLTNNQFAAVPFADGDGRSYAAYYAPYVVDPTLIVPVVESFGSDNRIHGSFAAPAGSHPNAFIDVYLLDTAALNNPRYWPFPMIHPFRQVGTFRDNDAADLNPNPNEFTFDLSSLALGPTTYVAVAVTYSQDAGRSEAGRSVTSPMSNPISKRSVLNLRLVSPETVELWWLGPPNEWTVQVNSFLDLPDNWLELFGEQHAQGRNYLTVPFDSFDVGHFFRLVEKN
jgi:hypothetical protein